MCFTVGDARKLGKKNEIAFNKDYQPYAYWILEESRANKHLECQQQGETNIFRNGESKVCTWTVHCLNKKQTRYMVTVFPGEFLGPNLTNYESLDELFTSFYYIADMTKNPLPCVLDGSEDRIVPYHERVWR